MAEYFRGMQAYGIYPLILFVIFVIIVGVFFLNRVGGFRWRDFYSVNAWRYPPVWKCGVIFAIVYLYLLPYVWKEPDIEISSLRFGWIITVAVLVVLIVPPGVAWLIALRSRVSGKEEKPGDLSGLTKDFGVLEKWLEKEKPIEKPADDCFGAAVVARRVARILRESPLKTIGLIGPYGCGKSSIVNMVGYYLKEVQEGKSGENRDSRKRLFDSRRIITCEVDGWAFCKETVAERVLELTVKKLARHIDCLGMMKLPAQYREAFSGAGSSWSKLFGSLLKVGEPEDILGQLDKVLGCARMRMVVFIEDLDRNAAGRDIVLEIAALLDRLKRLDNVSFVFAISEDQGASDVMTRISEHIERVPSLPYKEVVKLYQFFRDSCLTIYKEDIDCRSREEIDKRLGMHKHINDANFRALTVSSDSIIECIVKLLSTPRVVKSALRRTRQTWKQIHGEVDFDELLLVNILRFAAPEAFAFIHDKITSLRRMESGKLKTVVSSNQNPITAKKLWEESIGEVRWDRKAACKLVETLFPGFYEWSTNEVSPVQGIAGTQLTDYWVRLNAEELTDDELKDQTVLHAIDKWKRNNDADVYNGHSLASALLNEGNFADKVEQFGVQLNGKEVRQLAGQLFALILEGKGVRKTKTPGYISGEEYPGFIELWRLSLKKPVDWHEKWILEEIEKALAVSLRFANDLYYYWRSNAEHEKNAKPELQKGIIVKAKEIYTDIDIFIEAIDPDYIYSVVHFVNYLSEKTEREDIDYKEWRWLGDILVKAGNKSPQRVVPQIVCLIIEDKMLETDWQPTKLLEDRAKELFGQNLSQVMTLLTQEVNSCKFGGRERVRIQFGQQEAKKWLSKQV
jgi:hypothetical protein